MSWLTRKQEEDPITRLRARLAADKGILQMPGAHDAMAALLAKEAGFEALYLSGAAFSASLGLPDLGLITLSELAVRTREISRATGLPILVDVDTGYGSVLNVTRTVREMVDAGAAAIQIEDQDLPKKCGHLNGKKLVPKEEMVLRIQAARKASDRIVIVARTDAKSVEGLDAAIDRAKAYVKAGADAIFPEALQTEEEFRKFAQAIDVPLLANMTEFGQTPYYSAQQFEEWGYKMVIYPVTSLRVAAKAIERAYQLIRDTGTQKDALDEMQTRKELYETIRYFEYEDLDNRIAKTILDQGQG
ncbi:methylisocitrate lyase [Brevibacillus composti]|uniref:Methylisocitrate lyase n=1 Tax=Brevibacillus composti TaxID=2796470 RepID=A0A7T5JNV5_9BACL|nr:methylisocitrate lyase [Brevibacillus composti]QQE74506.1 methylisocitrate lyase [Brevibacillus composti]QUO41588.1 methylisocitrate lyase [Brevibacillus composti]